jgi:RNA polymerase sigma factor (sigma-70 family)
MAPPSKAAHYTHPDDEFVVRGIRRAPILRREDNDALARTIAAGGPEAERARAHMIEGNMRLVLIIARKYRDGPLTLQDRLQEGSIGLMKAITKFDPDRGISFATYASWWVRAFIERAVLGSEHVFNVPDNVASAIRRLRRAEATSQTPLTDDEVGAILSLSAKSVAAVRTLPTSVLSFDAPVSADDADGPTAGDIIADGSTNDPEEDLMLSEGRHILDRCPNLDERARTMVGLYLSGGTYQEIGDLYGVSRERVRQVLMLTMRMLRRWALKG